MLSHLLHPVQTAGAGIVRTARQCNPCASTRFHLTEPGASEPSITPWAQSVAMPRSPKERQRMRLVTKHTAGNRVRAKPADTSAKTGVLQPPASVDFGASLEPASRTPKAQAPEQVFCHCGRMAWRKAPAQPHLTQANRFKVRLENPHIAETTPLFFARPKAEHLARTDARDAT